MKINTANTDGAKVNENDEFSAFFSSLYMEHVIMCQENVKIFFLNILLFLCVTDLHEWNCYYFIAIWMIEHNMN